MCILISSGYLVWWCGDCESVFVFSLIYLPFPPILGSGDKDNSPSHSENLAGYPFSHSL